MGFATLVFAHVTFCVPFVIITLRARIADFDQSIEEAAMDLGCRPFQVFMLVTLPNIAPGIIAAWLLAFTLSFDDLVISEFLSGPGITTLPQVIFSYARRGINPTIYAAAALLILVVTVAVIAYSFIEARQSRRRLQRQE